jgi:hemolysin III
VRGRPRANRLHESPGSRESSIPLFADPFSALSHLLGAAAVALLSVPLVRKGRRATCRSRARVASLITFSASAVLLLGLSASYHMLVHESAARAVLQRLDHAAIFVLIAGTFTPVHAILFRGAWRWGMLALVWSIAVIGVTLKSVFFGGVSETLGLSLYLGMGWLGIISGAVLAHRQGIGHATPILAGGVAYTLGAVAERFRWPVLIPGVIESHEVFHVAVLTGLALHWWFVWRIADAEPTVCRPPSRPRP